MRCLLSPRWLSILLCLLPANLWDSGKGISLFCWCKCVSKAGVSWAKWEVLHFLLWYSRGRFCSLIWSLPCTFHNINVYYGPFFVWKYIILVVSENITFWNKKESFSRTHLKTAQTFLHSKTILPVLEISAVQTSSSSLKSECWRKPGPKHVEKPLTHLTSPEPTLSLCWLQFCSTVSCRCFCQPILYTGTNTREWMYCCSGVLLCSAKHWLI